MKPLQIIEDPNETKRQLLKLQKMMVEEQARGKKLLSKQTVLKSTYQKEENMEKMIDDNERQLNELKSLTQRENLHEIHIHNLQKSFTTDRKPFRKDKKTFESKFGTINPTVIHNKVNKRIDRLIGTSKINKYKYNKSQIDSVP